MSKTFKDVVGGYDPGEDDLVNVPEGQYDLEVVRCKNDAKKEYFQPVFRVLAGPYAGKQLMAGVLSYKESAWRVTRKKLAGFGIDEDVISAGYSADDIAKILVGRKVNVFLTTQKEGQYAGRNELPINGITLTFAPPLPGVGGTPTVPAAAPAPTPEPQPAPPVIPPAGEAPAAAAPAPAPVPEGDDPF